MKQMLKRLWTEESGQGMAEYGLILALVAVGCIAAFGFLGDAITARLTGVNAELNP